MAIIFVSNGTPRCLLGFINVYHYFDSNFLLMFRGMICDLLI